MSDCRGRRFARNSSSLSRDRVLTRTRYASIGVQATRELLFVQASRHAEFGGRRARDRRDFRVVPFFECDERSAAKPQGWRSQLQTRVGSGVVWIEPRRRRGTWQLGFPIRSIAGFHLSNLADASSSQIEVHGNNTTGQPSSRSFDH